MTIRTPAFSESLRITRRRSRPFCFPIFTSISMKSGFSLLTAAGTSALASSATTSKPSIFSKVERSETMVGSSSASRSFGIFFRFLWCRLFSWCCFLFGLLGRFEGRVLHFIHRFHKNKLHGFFDFFGHVIQILLVAFREDDGLQTY